MIARWDIDPYLLSFGDEDTCSSPSRCLTAVVATTSAVDVDGQPMDDLIDPFLLCHSSATFRPAPPDSPTQAPDTMPTTPVAAIQEDDASFALDTTRSSSIPSPISPIDIDTLSIACFSRWQPGADGHSPTTIALEREGETILILAHPNAPRQRGGPCEYSCINLKWFEFQPRGLSCGIRSGACVGDMIMQEPPVLYSTSCATPLDILPSQKNFIEAKRNMWNMSDSEQKLVARLEELHRRQRVPQSHVLDLFYSNTFRLPYTKDGCTLQSDLLFLTLAQIHHSCAPNARLRWNHSLGVMELVAIRDIEHCEEVTISYLPLALCLESSSRRQTWLKDEYGFICKCTSCSIPTISDPCRRFIAQAERDVAQSMAKLPHLKRAQIVELVEKILTILDRYEDDGLAPRVVQPQLSHTRCVADLYRWLDDAANEKVWRERATIEATAFDDDPHTTPALTDVLRPGSQSPIAFAVNDRRDYDGWAPAQREPRTSHSMASADQHWSKQSAQEELESAPHEHRPKRHRPSRQRSRRR